VHFGLYEVNKIIPERFFVRRAFGPVRSNTCNRLTFIIIIFEINKIPNNKYKALASSNTVPSNKFGIRVGVGFDFIMNLGQHNTRV
jgi:hypothetical protein